MGGRVGLKVLWGVASVATVCALVAPFRAAPLFAPSEQPEYYELLGQTFGLAVVAALIVWRWRPAGVRAPLIVVGIAAAIFIATMHSLAGKYAEPYPSDHPELASVSKGCVQVCGDTPARCESRCRCVVDSLSGRRPRSEMADMIKLVAQADRDGVYDDPRIQAFAVEAAGARADCGFPQGAAPAR